MARFIIIVAHIEMGGQNKLAPYRGEHPKYDPGKMRYGRNLTWQVDGSIKDERKDSRIGRLDSSTFHNRGLTQAH